MRTTTSGRIWPTCANEVSASLPAHPPLPACPAPLRAIRLLTGTTGRCLPGAKLQEGKRGARGEVRAREGLVPLQPCILVLLAVCMDVRTAAMHVLTVRSGPCVAVGSRSSFVPCGVYALHPYWWPWPPGSWVGCWGRRAPPARRFYSGLRAPGRFNEVHTSGDLSLRPPPAAAPTRL